jgi:uncharacterized protein YkwD
MRHTQTTTVDTRGILYRPIVRAALAALAGTLLALTAFTPAQAATVDHPQWSAEEQQFVYEMNRARWNPDPAEAAAGLAAGSIVPQPALAINDTLAASADTKSSDMTDNAYFGHQSPLTGLWPNQLARNAGYALPAGFPGASNNIESIASGNPYLSGVLQSFVNSSGHRSHILGQGWFANHREIGVGARLDSRTWTVQTAFQTRADLFITGVVFSDTDGDGVMDLGEGLAGVTVTEDRKSTITNEGGGWSLRVAKGTHQVSASGGSFVGVSKASVKVTKYNVEVDFVSGQAKPQVYSYALCNGKAPTILGTEGSDTIYGTPGDDIIQGGGGNDTIYGMGGNDIICGGAGRNTLVGGSGGGSSLLIGDSSAKNHCVVQPGDRVRKCQKVTG